jgi:hypothetical protein
MVDVTGFDRPSNQVEETEPNDSLEEGERKKTSGERRCSRIEKTRQRKNDFLSKGELIEILPRTAKLEKGVQ